ncbi:MAG: c-type cytochrome, partial [Rhodoferax sp.]
LQSQTHVSVHTDLRSYTEIGETAKENHAMKLPSKLLTLAAIGLSAAAFSGAAPAAVNADAASALAKKSGCLKCHAIDKDKSGPSLKSLAAKWKGKADAEAKLMDSLTKAPKVKLKDGTEEEHKVIDTKDAAEIKNVIAWILAQ